MKFIFVGLKYFNLSNVFSLSLCTSGTLKAPLTTSNKSGHVWSYQTKIVNNNFMSVYLDAKNQQHASFPYLDTADQRSLKSSLKAFSAITSECKFS